MRIAEAFANNDFAAAEELRDAWFVLHRSKFSLKNLPVGEIARANAGFVKSNGFLRLNQINILFDVKEVLSVFNHGSEAPTDLGYFVDLSDGNRGIQELIVHEIRHGTVDNVFDSRGEVKPSQDRESDADSFINRVY